MGGPGKRMSPETTRIEHAEDFAEVRRLREGFALIKRCESLCDSGRLEEAYQLLAANLSLLTRHADYQTACACLLCELGYHEQALAVCDAILKTAPQAHTALWWKAFALFRLERIGEALAAFDALLAWSPQYPNAAWMRAIALHRLRGERAAIVMEAYDRAAAADPKNPCVLMERADLLRVNGRYEEARDTYTWLRQPAVCDDAAMRLDATFKLGCVALVLNEVETAREAFWSVLHHDPHYPDARAMYRFTEEM